MQTFVPGLLAVLLGAGTALLQPVHSTAHRACTDSPLIWYTVKSGSGVYGFIEGNDIGSTGLFNLNLNLYSDLTPSVPPGGAPMAMANGVLDADDFSDFGSFNRIRSSADEAALNCPISGAYACSVAFKVPVSYATDFELVSGYVHPKPTADIACIIYRNTAP
ncbi:MAG: hypothetical protein P0Y53_12135 [Candidatus Pseudobacter hemicellulosilyticus]|uniref:Uncharacterized protein n=1 Tax=Candidatus Pseudobacter hemicellulosilyticus TaxID=3121375 RepID=A0AAJ5WXA6_9BACT|nr:MAG: hypothetical protein P0Y53_12135 [Pseudobacter sp.]